MLVIKALKSLVPEVNVQVIQRRHTPHTLRQLAEDVWARGVGVGECELKSVNAFDIVCTARIM
jgi:hypothetical protein